MKNLRKIIALFAIIFFTGIYVTVITIKTSLHKNNFTNKTVEMQKDTLYLINAEKKNSLT